MKKKNSSIKTGVYLLETIIRRKIDIIQKK